ncbi:MAG TPA: MOSC N-terminal beta barrel domain-containing protein [Candidatus Competibacteraceae bacterium]|nr:MOSC N-terminal beta barrel domain-containing protein [Candidatus Competibacteraceae bacterium]
MSELRITALYHYPLKSGRGIALDEARLDRYGIVGDRRWLVIDAQGRFLSQRRFPRMALLEARPAGEGVWLAAPGRAPLYAEATGAARQAKVWNDWLAVRDAGEEAARWLSAYLEHPCRLVAPDRERYQRPVNPDYDRWGSQVGFADGFPLLLISQGSLDELNRRLASPVDMRRFRPNIVVAGCAPHAEDGWKTLRSGGMILHVVKPCSRCTIPQVDPQTGEMGQEPTPTLAGYRRGMDGKIYFGQNLIHERAEGVLRVGDVVQVLA